ncbi:hypothetical protein N7492_006088 [Penicillium capsulatum]|uniref:Uncharacterized protein n=1 Tax=Penicillium capsulatum TaxID=69766 RepID=A0A9W9LLT1_9EURO|nr:hypothetical protein N7492_006088 [Penicillium capsulatum]KAJ6108738.1 hypothetical protein N7512_008575 [Penicillium capsulatum]
MARTVASCDLVTDLLQRLLDSGTDTRLIVCGTRTEFLVQLSAAIRSQRADSNASPRHDLLTKTIGLLANSSKIQLTFCSSLETLRAYMAVFGVTPEAERSPCREKQLVILDMVALHVSTTEFSAQGLSRTMAAAVEAASRTEMDLVLYECTNAVNPTSSEWGERLWATRIPLLNGSVRIRGEASAWAGRGVSVQQVAQRWFVFEKRE